LALALAEHN
jgi:hypothetical protein